MDNLSLRDQLRFRIQSCFRKLMLSPNQMDYRNILKLKLWQQWKLDLLRRYLRFNLWRIQPRNHRLEKFLKFQIRFHNRWLSKKRWRLRRRIELKKILVKDWLRIKRVEVSNHWVLQSLDHQPRSHLHQKQFHMPKCSKEQSNVNFLLIPPMTSESESSKASVLDLPNNWIQS